MLPSKNELNMISYFNQLLQFNKSGRRI